MDANIRNNLMVNGRARMTADPKSISINIKLNFNTYPFDTF